MQSALPKVLVELSTKNISLIIFLQLLLILPLAFAAPQRTNSVGQSDDQIKKYLLSTDELTNALYTYDYQLLFDSGGLKRR